MARYNTKTQPVRAAKSPVKTAAKAGTRTYEGHQGYVSDAQGELFRLGVNLFAGGEDTFYEGGKVRDDRFSGLVSQLALEDPAFVAGFLPWLRGEGNIRTAAQLGAVDAVHARLAAEASDAASNGVGYNRKLLTSVAQRLDEVGEQFAIWTQKHGRPYPSALKRAAGDSFDKLLNEYSWMKYDTSSHAWRVADVVELAHLKASSPEQAELFRMAIASRRGNSYEVREDLSPMVAANFNLRREVEKDRSVLLNPEFLRAAGMTWEDALSLAGNKVDKAKLWEAMILSGMMGYMALLRNLRNFQEAGISNQAVAAVNAKLSDPTAAAKSRQFPFRFWSAYKNARGTQWAHALETGLDLVTQNIPELPGKTAVLIDTSGSMSNNMSGKSTIRMDEAAALFGSAVAVRNPGRVALYMYASNIAPVRSSEVQKGESVLRLTEEVTRRNGEVGYGTETAKAVAHAVREVNPDRIMIFTDGQSWGTYGRIEDKVKASTKVYAWNLAGYRVVDLPSGETNRHQLAGLSDGTFKLIPLLERGRDARWPWQEA